MTPEQRAELLRRWQENPYSYRELFEGEQAVPVTRIIEHLTHRGMTQDGAIGWLATMAQVGRVTMISSNLVGLGPRAEHLPAWVVED